MPARGPSAGPVPRGRPAAARGFGPLWACPRCHRRFANRNQSHACGRHDLEDHFRGKDPSIRALFVAMRRAVAACGPVTVLPEKTRIAFQVRMSFAQVSPRRHWLDGHLVLARRLPHPRFRRIDSLSRRNHVHHFRIASPGEVDAEFRGWLREAYSVGAQEHLRGGRRPQSIAKSGGFAHRAAKRALPGARHSNASPRNAA
jgi:hypothetical protein